MALQVEIISPVTEVSVVGSVQVIEVGGATGPAGPLNLFIQDTQPVTTLSKYLWIQTGMGVDGTGFTINFEDGK